MNKTSETNSQQRSIAFDSKKKNITPNIEIGQWKSALSKKSTLLWVDLCGEPSDVFEAILRDIFCFHHLAIEDALIDLHVPRVDDWDDHIYLTLRCTAIKNEDPLEISIPELDVFVGENYLVTYHKQPLAEIDALFEQCGLDIRVMEKGAANLFYQLADEMANNYMPVIETIGEVIDQIEDDIFEDPRNEVLSSIFSLKRTMLRLRSTFLPQREVFNKLARGDYQVIPEEQRVYFRDIYDHMARLEELNESLRDLVSGALDTYLSVVNNRMNDVMKTLTIITTLFMPLAFITGFFGMNFFQASNILTQWTNMIPFVIVLASVILIPLFMYLWMRRRNWM